MFYLRMLLVVLGFSSALSPTLRAADPEERKEASRLAVLPTVLMDQVCGFLEPVEVATKVRLVCSKWKNAQGAWDKLITNDGGKKLSQWFDLCVTSSPCSLDCYADEHLGVICSRTSLKKLSFLSYFSDKKVGEIAKLLEDLNLETLVITYCDEGFTGVTLSSFTNLKSLRICYCPSSDWTRNLAACTELRNLSIMAQEMPDKNLGDLVAGCPNLRELTLKVVVSAVNSIGDNGIAHLVALKSLKKLTLISLKKITDKGIAHLSDLELDELKLIHIPQMGCSTISRLESLKTLELSCSQITDSNLLMLSDCQSLRKLKIAHARVTKEGLAHLLKLRNLQILVIAECPYIQREKIDGQQYLLENRFLQFVICLCITMERPQEQMDAASDID